MEAGMVSRLRPRGIAAQPSTMDALRKIGFYLRDELG